MVYVDPHKLEAYHLSPMDIVRKVNSANLILPGGDVQIGARDYNVYTNSQLDQISEINDLPIKVDDQALVRISDIGVAKDANQIQTTWSASMGSGRCIYRSSNRAVIPTPSRLWMASNGR
jgi:multidrug efflux pump subunit AcrB